MNVVIVPVLWAALAVLIVNFLATSVQVLLQASYTILPVKAPLKQKRTNEPRVSIHIAAYNEPPVLLKNTLRALSRLSYSNYEVIVLDNNTKDESTWKPVEAYCKELGSKFTFFHIDPLAGFKAGALNYILTKMDPNAEYIVTIDADYEVQPDFLDRALAYFTEDKIAFVQFPQSYKNVTRRNRGLAAEYEHFFATYMRAANRLNCVTATGTLTVFRPDALKKVGRYDNESLTEDTDMGIRLIAAGYKGVFIDEIVGNGLIPYELAAYKKQKTRWAKGNSLILMKHFVPAVFDGKMSIGQRIGLLSQLTCWLNGTLIPIGLVLAIAIAHTVTRSPLLSVERSILVVSTAAIAVLIIGKLGAFVGLFGKRSLNTAVRAWLIHMGMNWVYATTFLKTFLHNRLTFERTNKFIRPMMHHTLRGLKDETIIVVLSILLVVLSVLDGTVEWVLVVPLILIAALHAAVYYVYYEFGDTKEASAQIMKELERSF